VEFIVAAPLPNAKLQRKPSWLRILILFPFVLFVSLMSWRVDPRRARWAHVQLSVLIVVFGVWDPKYRWFAVGYVAVAGFNFFCYWLIIKCLDPRKTGG